MVESIALETVKGKTLYPEVDFEIINKAKLKNILKTSLQRTHSADYASQTA